MKPFTKRLALVTGLLFTAMLCLGIVYIDTVNNYWQFSGGFIRLVVNTNAQASIAIDTNTLRFGINTNNTIFSVHIIGKKPATASSGNGSSALNTGGIQLQGASGGDTTDPANNRSGGQGGAFNMVGGSGGTATASTTNSTGGGGGTITATGGAGNGGGTLVTNAMTGGQGGNLTFTGGAGGGPTAPATNTVGGTGGSVTIQGGTGGTPSAGWAIKGGSGGSISLIGGTAVGSTRTNSGVPGAISLTAGSAAPVSLTPGNPAPGADINLTSGNGSTGDTNSNGGHVFIAGGSPGSGAAAGNTILNMTSAGSIRGNVGVSTNAPRATLHVKGDFALTSSGSPGYLAAGLTNNVLTTNWLGRAESTAAAVIEAAFNQYSELVVTNRIAAVTQINLTNGSPGYAEMTITAIGEASGGASRVMTLVANTGQLIANLDTFGTALATSYAFTLTNGNAVVISDHLRQMNGTNVHQIITRQFAF